MKTLFFILLPIIQSLTHTLSKSFTLSGRASRRETLIFTIFAFLICFLALPAYLSLINEGIAGLASLGLHYKLISCPALVLYLLIIPAGFSLTIRRLHDTGRSAWTYFTLFILTIAVPSIGFWLGLNLLYSLLIMMAFLLYLHYCVYFQKGSLEENEYGPQPVL